MAKPCNENKHRTHTLHSKVRYITHCCAPPHNITHGDLPQLQNSSFNISKVFRNVNAICISRKNILSLY